MLAALTAFYRRYLSSTEAGQLLFILILLIAIVLGMHAILMPLFIGIILAYLLELFVYSLSYYCKVPRFLAVIIVFLLFIGLVILILIVWLPILIKQVASLVTNLPSYADQIQSSLQLWLYKVNFISDQQLHVLIDSVKLQLYNSLKPVLTLSLTFIPGILTGIVYLIMVPLLLYFLLMDKPLIVNNVKHFLPSRREKLIKIWQEVYLQIGNYVRGKVLEAFIVIAVAYLGFMILKLQYAALLSVLVGLSVFIPYIGGIVVTIPVITIALLQWGLTTPFIYCLIVYSCIMAFDGTILTALLFSEALALHPLAIMIAILIFGGIWGVWGVFFAMPLACLVKALLTHWPVKEKM